MNYQRLILGLFSVVAIVAGLILWILNEGDNNNFSGILVRGGLMSAAVWLAFPVITRPQGQRSLALLGASLVSVVIVAARPKIFFATIIVFAMLACGNWLLKKISNQV